MIEAHEPAARVDDDPDRVEAQLGGVRARADLEQEGRGHAADLAALALVQGLPWASPGGAGATRLDLHEDQRRPVEHDEVEFAVARAVVARHERVAEALEVGEGEILADTAEVLTQVGGHERRR